MARVGNAVRIRREEGVVLRHAEGQGVDAHLAGAAPFLAAGVVSDALRLHQARRQVTDGVAAQQEGVSGAWRTARKVQDDLRGGFAAILEMPPSLVRSGPI